MSIGDQHDKGVMCEHADPLSKPRKRSKLITALVWVITALLVPLCLAWVVGQWVYWFDILASQQMLIGWVALALGSLILAGMRWIAGSVCVVLALVSLYPVFVGRVWLLPSIDLKHKPDGVIRVVSSNINPVKTDWEHDIEHLFSLNADILVLIESTWGLLQSIKNQDMLESSPFSFWTYRRWVDEETSRVIILSRWPLEAISSDDPEYAQHHLHTQVQSPSGSFVIGVMHPMSPRTAYRWVKGNRVSESHTREIRRIRKELGLPILIGADLNAGPAQQRARLLRRTGLQMSKPVLRFGGSFPTDSSLPATLRIQLDDIWSLGDITPIAWGMTKVPGSDHMAVITEFRLNNE